MQLLWSLVVVLLAPLQVAQADVWQQFVESAAEEHGEPGRRAAEFLREHRPPRDSEISLELLEQNLRLALRARQEFPWAKALPEELFLNDVLPYASVDETRESWRPEFYERARAIVAGCTTATEAAQALNQKLFNDVGVHYNTGRKKPNQSPAESIAQGRATCTGLSILLVDACRAVGLPARVAGVASWHDKRGNHTWVEVWDDGWHFTGADEYDAKGLNRGWFTGDAGKAQLGSVEHAVWASSWSATGNHFPMVWNRQDQSVPAVDVTARYLPKEAKPAAAVATLFVRLWSETGGERVIAAVSSVGADGTAREYGQTRAGTADLNDMLAIPFTEDSEASLCLLFAKDGAVRTARVEAPAAGTHTLDLAWDQLGLGKAEAEGLIEERWRARCEQLGQEAAAELEAQAFQSGEHSLRWKERVFGDRPEGGHSLWISMHGGGGAPTRVNDQQWDNQIKLYEPAEGIYIAPRAPSDTWNLWHRAEVDVLFGKLIDAYVATRGVNPNRVYLMGYSAGGDGVYQLAPRMADRFGAASMMAGHPNETQPLGLRNLPFAIYMGGNDAAYDRNKIAAQWGEKLAALRADDPEGYPHQVTIYEGLGHWMQRRDASALPWMASHERNPWPKKVIWHQDDVTHERFYWLAVPAGTALQRSTVKAWVEGQTIHLETEGVSSMILRLRDELIDLDRPVAVIFNGEKAFDGRVQRTEAAIQASLRERVDPFSAATALLTVELPD